MNSTIAYLSIPHISVYGAWSRGLLWGCGLLTEWQDLLGNRNYAFVVCLFVTSAS